jgi:DNA-binding MarR family transcriptional regulator
VSDLLSVFSDLVRVETLLWNALDSQLRVELGIPLGRFETLQVIGRRGTCRVNDIADDLVITWSGMSKIVDRLEASALCRRRPNPEDGRSSLIDLTDSGRTLLAQGEAILLRELTRLLEDPLPQRRRTDFAGTLSRLRQTAGRPSDVAGTV